MIETVKSNFPGEYKNDTLCNSCKSSECNQPHLIYCKSLIGSNQLITYIPNYEDIFDVRQKGQIEYPDDPHLRCGQPKLLRGSTLSKKHEKSNIILFSKDRGYTQGTRHCKNNEKHISPAGNIFRRSLGSTERHGQYSNNNNFPTGEGRPAAYGQNLSNAQSSVFV